jgi:hypothetical protein
MAQSGFTPIQLYYSTTTTNTPSAGNLADGELAINITDGKLFYKDNLGAVQVIANKNAVANVSSISFGSTGFTPSTATTGAITVSGTLAATSGGTGQSSYTVGDLVYASTTTALSKLADVATGNALISGGVGVAPSYGKIGLTTHVSGTLPVANGGTGTTALTANNVILGNNTSAVQFVAPGTAGNVLTSNGTTWTSAAASASLAGQTDSASPFETSLGYQAGNSVTGINNTFIGYQSGDVVTNGYENTCVGHSTLGSSIGGYRNVAIGSSAMSATSSLNLVNNSTAVGYNALAIVEAASNVAIGSGAASTLTTGNNNTYVGSYAIASSSSVSGEVVLGYALTGKGGQTAYIGGVNGAYNAKNVTTWETTSDERIKRNIVDSPKGLAEVKQLRVRNFNYKLVEDMPLNAEGKPIIDNLDPNRLVTGFIAQELQTVMPECVNTTASGLLSVSSDAIIYALVKAVQELAAEVEALKG